jgi:hypothetical protein
MLVKNDMPIESGFSKPTWAQALNKRHIDISYSTKGREVIGSPLITGSPFMDCRSTGAITSIV